MGLLSLFLFSLFVFSDAEISSKIGINYGQLGKNLPSPRESIELIKAMQAGRVKLYDANPEILKLLSGTNIQVSIMIPNDEITSISTNQTKADEWVQNNVIPYYPDTQIRFLLVGNEVLSYFTDKDREIWLHLVPAMHRIKQSLHAMSIKKIRVGTPLAMDVLESTFPPSSGRFRRDISQSVMAPMLRFINQTRSFFFIDVYPYFSWSKNTTNISLDFALLREIEHHIDLGSGLTYTNLLDQMLDSLHFAMAKLGYHDIRLLISETGWPNSGDIEEAGANIYNAATYNRNLIKKMTSKPPRGTPAQPHVVIPTFIFALFNENQKNGPGTERHWGLLNPNGTSIYQIDLTGKQPLSKYIRLPMPQNNEPFKGNAWCVVTRGANMSDLGLEISSLCSGGNGTCEALAPGGRCYEPVSITRHASYAFSSYWSKFRNQGVSCYFNGLAEQTTKDPSIGSCRFPSVTF